jgi:hypothetical protein
MVMDGWTETKAIDKKEVGGKKRKRKTGARVQKFERKPPTLHPLAVYKYGMG